MSNLFHDAGLPATGQKVMLATTSYDSPDASYTHSIACSRTALHEAGIGTAYLLLQGNCHVDDARNTVVREFLDSDCTDLVFLDADVSWQPEHLVKLCQYDVPMVGGVYPYRREAGYEQMPVRMLEGITEADETGLMEVSGLPTGFLRMRREVLETLAANAPTFRKNGREYPELFKRDIFETHPNQDNRRGGDIRFTMMWREAGGKVYAASELRLGHCGKHIIRDSLGASLRRQKGETLEYVCRRIQTRQETEDDLLEAIKYVNNPFGAPSTVLGVGIALARKATKPIIECGSGLSTVLIAAATDQQVWAIENHPNHAQKLRDMVKEAGLTNVVLVTAAIKDGWYDLSADAAAMPERFGLAIVDGPPRYLGDRMKFFDHFGQACDVMLFDDADGDGYLNKLREWAAANGRQVNAQHRVAVISDGN